MVHTPSRHAAGGMQLGPATASHAAPSGAAASQVPSVDPSSVRQKPLAPQRVTAPSAELPHGSPTAEIGVSVQTLIKLQ